MDLTPEQIAELQQKAKEADELKQRLEAIAGNKKDILDEHAKTKQRLRELEEAEKARKQKELEEQGKLKELLEAARRDAEEARKEREDALKAQEQLNQERVKDRMRADFMAAAAGKVQNPEHLWTLFAGGVADKDGATTVTYKGSELAPDDFIGRLSNDPVYTYMFPPARPGGMGAPKGGAAAPATGGNPWIDGNVTAQLMMQLEDAEQAAKLQAEAKAYLAAQAAKR
jgi:Spy/CpxP family protein refolding chaperone